MWPPMTRGGGGVKKSWNSCDVIYGWPLIGFSCDTSGVDRTIFPFILTWYYGIYNSANINLRKEGFKARTVFWSKLARPCWSNYYLIYITSERGMRGEVTAESGSGRQREHENRHYAESTPLVYAEWNVIQLKRSFPPNHWSMESQNKDIPTNKLDNSSF